MSSDVMRQARGALRELVAQVEGRYLSLRHDHFAMQNARAAIRRLEEAIADAEKSPDDAIPTHEATRRELPAYMRSVPGIVVREVDIDLAHRVVNAKPGSITFLDGARAE